MQWTNKTCDVFGNDGDIVATCTHSLGNFTSAHDNAALIVKAVNCHLELLKQLKVCRDEMLADGWTHESLEDVEQAIAKAEGKL